MFLVFIITGVLHLVAIKFVELVIFYGFYHDKSPSNHHLGACVLFFSKQIQAQLWFVFCWQTGGMKRDFIVWWIVPWRGF